MANEVTVEALQAEIQQLKQNVQGLAQERDQYRSQAQAGQGGGGNGNPAANAHVMERLTGLSGDWSQADQYYVTREQYLKDLQRVQQEAVNQAFNLAYGNQLVGREIDRTTATHKDLGTWDSPLAKKTLDILQKEGYASPRVNQYGIAQPISSWEELVYSDARGLSKAARMAQAELILAEKEAAASTSSANQAGQQAGMAGGGGSVVAGASPATEEKWMEAADKGDLAALRQMGREHFTAVTGQAYPTDA